MTTTTIIPDDKAALGQAAFNAAQAMQLGQAAAKDKLHEALRIIAAADEDAAIACVAALTKLKKAPANDIPPPAEERPAARRTKKKSARS